MCELFALSSRLPATVDISLEAFARRGGRTGPHRDGWGIACYEGLDARVVRDTTTAADSDWVQFLESHPLRSTRVISHVRRSTIGDRVLANTQPFVRQLGGRMHVFAHNGHLADIWNEPALQPGFHWPVGDTDSEYAFCALLARLERPWRGAEPPTIEDRVDIVSGFAETLRLLGPANFLYSDGELLVGHGHRRTQSDGGIAPPGLWILERACPAGDGELDTHGLKVDPEGQRVILLASVPLTDEAWRPLAEGEVVAFRGAVNATRPTDPSYSA